MKFKPKVWRPIAWILVAVNVVAVGPAAAAAEPMHAAVHAALAVAFVLWAQRLGRALTSGGGGADIDRMAEILEQQADALDDTRNALDLQSRQLGELAERVDFAERMLAQVREHRTLAPPG